MSSLRPESNKSHQLGSNNIRWSNLYVGGIDTNEKVKIDPINNSEIALEITGSMELKSGDISLFDSNDSNKEYKVLETLLNLSNSNGNIDETNLVHISGALPETISNFKYFTGGLQLKIQNNSTYKIDGTILAESNDGTIPTTNWVTNKLSNISIDNATTVKAGKVRLAIPLQIASGIDIAGGGEPVVVQPSQLSGSISNAITQLKSELASGLIYKGAIEIIDNNGTNVIYPNTITGSLQGDFYYIKTGGVISSSTGIVDLNDNIVETTFIEGDIVVFKDDATDPLLIDQFDIIQNSFSFEQIKNLLENNNNTTNYIAKYLYSEGIIDNNDPPNLYTIDKFIKTTGENISIIDDEGNNPTYDFSVADHFYVPSLTFDPNTPPTIDERKNALNINSLEDYFEDRVSINILKDVQTVDPFIPTNGQVLTYITGVNNDINKWVPQTLNISTNLKQLSDVSIIETETAGRETLQDGQVLLYSSSLGKWVNSAKVTMTGVAYASASNNTTTQTFLQNNLFTSGVQNTHYNINDITNNPATTYVLQFPLANSNLDINTPITSTINKILYLTNKKDIPSIEWVNRKQLKKVISYTLNSDLDLQSKYITDFKYSNSNFAQYNDFIWNIRPISNSSSYNITLPDIYIENINTSYSNGIFKTGFTVTIKNIPNDIVAAKLNPENFVINIKPKTGQYIDFELDEIIKIVPFSSVTFVVSDGGTSKNIPGWIAI